MKKSMTFFAETITTFYDKEQDRLSLVFTDKDQQKLQGLMTRQFFKNLLAHLPNWLMKKRADAMPQTIQQQWEINQIYHQVSQQEVTVLYGKIESNQHFENFLIATINFSKRDLKESDQKIRLEFLDSNKTIVIFSVFNLAQLHKLIGEIFKQVQVWDLENPWEEKDLIAVSSDTGDKVMH